MRRIPNELKIPFIQMEKIFSQFVDKFLKIEEVDYLKYGLCITQKLKNVIFNFALGWTLVDQSMLFTHLYLMQGET